MQTILNVSNLWDAYNKRKLQNGQDPNCFSPEELWEFNYLLDLIHGVKPHLDQITVILAVREGMRRTLAPRLREHFVQLVLDNITERENQWSNLMQSMGEGVKMSSSSMQFPYIPN
jgi:hypothetical protein